MKKNQINLIEFCENENLQLLKEWNFKRNENINIKEIHSLSSKSVWWMCEKGHEWKAPVSSRTRLKTNCPYCSGRYAIRGENDLATTHPKLAKEWHPTKNADLTPFDVKAGSSKKVWWICEKGHEWEAQVANRKRISGGGCPYCSNKKLLKGYNDLNTTHPYISKEWHNTKNEDLKPNQVVAGSNKKVWWICEKGHEWQATIVHRTEKKGSKCPYCSGLYVIKGENDLATTHPEIAKEWHPTKNGDLNPSYIKYGSGQKVWWICEKGHEWKTTISHRTGKDGTNCPYCSGAYVIKGENDLATTHPKLITEWHPTKNADLTPFDAKAGSSKKVWWICEKGHEWKTAISNRTGKDGTNCPYCSGSYVLEGENDLATVHPEIAKQWHPTKNGDLSPSKISSSSNKKVWWMCEKGHEWEVAPNSRAGGKTNCPYCSNKKLLKKYNDLETVYPEIAKEWHPTKNGDLKPSDILPGTGKKVWWMCEKGHEWKTTPNTRTTSKNNCPYCSGLYAIKGENDLATTHPKLITEWHPTKNADLTPFDVKAGSSKKVWWVCEKGHEWKAVISSRTHGCNCPKCNEYRRVSFPEKAIYYYINKVFFDTKSNYKDTTLDSRELDIFIPSLKFAIEYDGEYYHTKKTIHRDEEKNSCCVKNNIFLIRIREEKCPDLKEDDNILILKQKCNDIKILKNNIEQIFNIIKKRYDINIEIPIIDIEKDMNDIYELLKSHEVENSLEAKFPEIAKEWHPVKNGNLKPSHFISGSRANVWWMCEKGHEWKTTLDLRVRQKTKCPYCLNRKVWPGYNDLATTHPQITKEWHPIKNEGLEPTNITYGSEKKVWWMCEKGHEWEATPNARNSKKSGCPHCRNLKKTKK